MLVNDLLISRAGGILSPKIPPPDKKKTEEEKFQFSQCLIELNIGEKWINGIEKQNKTNSDTDKKKTKPPLKLNGCFLTKLSSI